MSDPNIELISSVASNVITEIFKSIIQSGRWLVVKGKELDLLGTAARRYCQKLEQRYNVIRILGMDRPIPLRNIYVSVNILGKISSRQRVSLEDLEKDFDRDQRRFGRIEETKPGHQVANELLNFIVLGKPGAGKTTFLKFLTLQSLDGRTRIARLPIFISLKDFSDSDESLLDFIVGEFSICQFPDAQSFVVHALEKGKCQILFDGLDEVSKVKEDDVVRQIVNFSEEYDRNQFILSCRIAAYNHYFPRFIDVELADFDDEQIRTFIFNWFADDLNTAELCLSKLRETPQIQELASVPLLLTLLCIAFNESLEFPQNRAELYKEAIDALLKKWDATRRIRREELYKHLPLRRKESLFSNIAAITFEKGEYFLHQRTLEQHISTFIENLPEAKDETLQPDSEAILKSIEAQHGIFVERAQGIHSFSHLTFQEYFTAKYIVDNVKKRTLESLVKEHIADDRWREVFFLTAGMLPEADDLIILMSQRIKKCKSNRDVAEYMKNVVSLVKSHSPLYIAKIRAIALLQALSVSVAHAGFKNLDQSRDYTRKIIDDLTPILNIEDDTAFEFDFMIDPDRLKRLEKEFGLTDLGFNRAIGFSKDLLGYLRLNELLTKCLNAEPYMSKSTRQRVLNELFILH